MVRIKDIDIFPAGYQALLPGREEPQHHPTVLIKLRTDAEYYGVGEAPAYTTSLGDTEESTSAALRRICDAIAGMNVWQIAELHERMTWVTGSQGGRIPEAARSAVDMALYDIAGKIAGEPLYRLLGGGYRSAFTILGTEWCKTLDGKLEIINGFLQDGYRGLEVKVRIDEGVDLGSVREQAWMLRRVLEEVPGDVQVIADMNQRWGSTANVVSSLASIAPHAPNLYIEQPVHYADLAGLSRVTAALSCHVIADESAMSAEAVAQLARQDAANMISIKLPRVGGIYPALRMIAAAEAAGMEVRTDTVPHGRIADTATCHVASVIRIPHPVSDGWTWLSPDFTDGGVQLSGGRILLPDAPGLGVDFEESAVVP